MPSNPSSDHPRHLVLPHFNYVVPLLTGPDGYPCVPVFVLCRMLELDEAYEIQRAQRVLLWDMAALLPITHRGRACFAWSLPYPLQVGYWFSQVYRRVRNPQRRQQLDLAIDDSMDLSAVAHRLIEAKFEAGRKRMYQLGLAVTRLRELLGTLAERSIYRDRDRDGTGDKDSAAHQMPPDDALGMRGAAVCDQAEQFVREWFAHVGSLPVVDGIRADAEGRVLEQDVPITLFGTIRDEDLARLDHYEQLVAQVIAEVEAALGGGAG